MEATRLHAAGAFIDCSKGLKRECTCSRRSTTATNAFAAAAIWPHIFSTDTRQAGSHEQRGSAHLLQPVQLRLLVPLSAASS